MDCVKLENVCKSYGTKQVLTNFSLTVKEGDFISIMGASGSGKTTLLNLIGMLDTPDAGCVSILGYDNPVCSSLNILRLRRTEIAYLFQNYGLIENETVKENLNLASHFQKITKAQKREKYAKALSEVGLAGYETRKVFTLSGGEQQRVALAKVIIKSPKLILADEPTGSLDPQNRNAILSLLNKLNHEGKTIIVVTHDPYVDSCAKKHIYL